MSDFHCAIVRTGTGWSLDFGGRRFGDYADVGAALRGAFRLAATARVSGGRTEIVLKTDRGYYCIHNGEPCD